MPRLTVDVTPELNERINQLSEELGRSKGGVFRMGIALYEALYEGTADGNHFAAVVDSDGKVVSRIVGLSF